ncbi:hypothetical protein TRAPUB_2124 [Trametes pubescens]|uniref:Uncharacterized protein n=1 Tax=Trametes pubescens TaxID=154538 RepID=A0A1M2VHG0_TRAPU|nr:hypothetical protein TRAPUB_2124 [Trametes pubescens]
MLPCNLIFIDATPKPCEDERPPSTHRERLRHEVQGRITGMLPAAHPGELTGDEEAEMRYATKCYANGIVIRYGCKITGWPEDIPFKCLSEIPGGVRPLLELRRRWNLPDGHQHKLRLEHATPEDLEKAARDPRSVHPNPTQLEEGEKEVARKAAMRKVVTPAATAAEFIPSYVFHPVDLRFLGVELNSTQPSAPVAKRKRSQRKDSGKRRRRASDNSLRVRKRLPMRGITSMCCVIPGVDGVACGGDERAAKRVRLEDCPVDDPITEFELSTEFGGRLSDHDVFMSA